VTEDSDTWAVTASGQTHTLTNGGEDEAYPVLTLTPTGAKTGGYAYRRWVPVTWRSQNAGAQYPVMATLATDAIVTAGKMQADGDDLRVLVDGIETYRWLSGMNGAATKVWFSADFTRAPDLSLKTAIADSGTIASIEFNEVDELQYLPESGILLIDSEAFVYTARNLTDASVTGISRAAKGTASAAHTVGDDVQWVQHDVWIVYGNASATAPTVDNDYKPAFELDHSDNSSWVYETFGDSAGKRAARWAPFDPITISGKSGVYTATHRTLGSPYTVIGAWRTAGGAFAQGWYLANPCGIVNAAWADGQARAEDKDSFLLELRYWVRGASWWTNQLYWNASSTPLGADNTWQAWSEAAAASDWSPADDLALILYAYNGDAEAGTVTVSLSTSEVPVVTVNGEQGNYELAATITNQTTGEAITVGFVMDLDSELEVDTDERTVTWGADDSGQFQALSLSAARRHWLRLLPGANVLRFDDAGTNGVTVVAEWEERWY
jgi:hypothetical protein